MDLLRDNELIYGRLLTVSEPHLIKRVIGLVRHRAVNRTHIDRRGQQGNHRIEEQAGAFALECGARADGRNLAFDGALAQRREQRGRVQHPGGAADGEAGLPGQSELASGEREAGERRDPRQSPAHILELLVGHVRDDPLDRAAGRGRGDELTGELLCVPARAARLVRDEFVDDNAQRDHSAKSPSAVAAASASCQGRIGERPARDQPSWPSTE